MSAMGPVRSASTSRRLLVWFVAATALPLAGITWLGWKVVEQDRAAERTRVVERREQAVGVASASLQRVLAEAEEQLTGLDNLPAGSSLDPGSSFANRGAAAAMLDRRGLVGRGGVFLPYYPSPGQITAPSTVFARAERAEFLKNEPVAAIGALQPLTHSPDPAVRAEALLRIARNYRKAGDLARAEATYRVLESYENTHVDDIAVGLAAVQGRALLLHATGRVTELRRAAAELAADLDGGRWVLTKAQYEHGRHQAHIWIGEKGLGGEDADRLALADTTDIAWREWLAPANGHVVARGRRVLRTEHGPTLLLWRATGDRVAMLVIGRRFLETAWLAEVQSSILGEGIVFALTDADGRPVIGGTDVPVSEQSVRTPRSQRSPGRFTRSVPALPDPKSAGRRSSPLPPL